MSAVIDFHSHILPEIDDGSSSLKESIAMLKQEAEQGIGHVIATPHFYAQHSTPERFLTARAEAEARLREEMERYDGLPRVSVGAEVLYFRGISHSDMLKSLTIAGTKYILVEMPAPPWTDTMYRELEEIHAGQGLMPIIAHVDRYISPFRTYGIPERLEELPTLVQANAGFFLRGMTRRMALKLLREDRIHLLGSDCHSLTDRAPNLGPAVSVIRQHLGRGAIRHIQVCQEEVLAERMYS